MADPTGPMIQIGTSPGEVGGLFAGFVALIVALGHGLKWWLGWTDRRAATRAAKLDAWQKQLEDRERDLWEKIEVQLDGLRSQHAALLGGYQLIAGALRLIDPHNDALRRADELLRSAFVIEPQTPADMTRTILAAKRPDEGKPR